MVTAETILVIFLSGFLAIFLVLACVVAAKTIQILNHLKSISEKAEKLADSAEHVGDILRFTAGPAAIAKLFATIHDNVFKKVKHKRKANDE